LRRSRKVVIVTSETILLLLLMFLPSTSRFLTKESVYLSRSRFLSSPAVIGNITLGPVGSSIREPVVSGNVSISRVQLQKLSSRDLPTVYGFPNGTNELTLDIQASDTSAILRVQLSPSAEVLGVLFLDKWMNFTYDKATRFLSVVISGPFLGGILHIFYFLSGGLIGRIESSSSKVSMIANPSTTARIHGYVFTDFTNWNARVAGIKVELHKNDWPLYSYLATSYTDSSGLYDFGLVDLSSVGYTLRLRVYTEGWSSGGTGWKQRVVVKNSNNFDAEIYGDFVHTYQNDDAYYLNLASTWMDPNSDFDDGIHSYYSIWKEFSQFRDQFGFVTSERGVTTAHLFAQSTSSDGYNINIQSSLYAYTPLITEHEFSHCVFYQAYGDHWADFYSQYSPLAGDHQDFNFWHTGHVTADPDTAAPCSNDAVNEGWAEFVPCVIENNPSWPIGDGSGGIAYYQALPDGYGELNEFGFAGSLWDLLNTSGQSSSTMFSDIWQVTLLDHPGRVDSFYSAFVVRFPSLATQTRNAFLTHFVMWSSLTASLSTSSVGPGNGITISGNLAPVPHVGRTVGIYVTPVSSSSWSLLATAVTGSDSTYVASAIVNLSPGSYLVKASWGGDRNNPSYPFTGHSGADSGASTLQVTAAVTRTIYTSFTLSSTSMSYATTSILTTQRSTTTTTSYYPSTLFQTTTTTVRSGSFSTSYTTRSYLYSTSTSLSTAPTVTSLSTSSYVTTVLSKTGTSTSMQTFTTVWTTGGTVYVDITTVNYHIELFLTTIISNFYYWFTELYPVVVNLFTTDIVKDTVFQVMPEKDPSAITLLVDGGNSAIKAYGTSFVLNGSITPSTVGSVTLQLSIDGGASWNSFVIVSTGVNGQYTMSWTPPYPGVYLVKASWPGNAAYFGSQSNSPYPTVTVTGPSPPKIALLISGPSSVASGGSVTFDVLADNPGSATSTTLYFEVTGPGGYWYFDTQQVAVAAGGRGRFQFLWQVPRGVSTGQYQVSVSLVPPKSTAIAQTQITVQ
jgi:hypothetical protein